MGIADRLHLTVVDDQLIERHIADRLQIEPALVRRTLEGGASALNPWRQRREDLLKPAAEKVLELASSGNVVIQGWSAADILQPVAHVLRVCVGCCRQPLQQQKWFGWPLLKHSDPTIPYDIVLAARMSAQTCVEHIERLVPIGELRETESSRTMLARLLETARENAGRPQASGTHAYLDVRIGRDRLKISDTLGVDERIACIERHLRGDRSRADRSESVANRSRSAHISVVNQHLP